MAEGIDCSYDHYEYQAQLLNRNATEQHENAPSFPANEVCRAQVDALLNLPNADELSNSTIDSLAQLYSGNPMFLKYLDYKISKIDYINDSRNALDNLNQLMKLKEALKFQPTFEITGGYIERKTLDIDWKGGIKFNTSTKNKRYEIQNDHVEYAGKINGKDRYNLSVEYKNDRNIIIQIEYNGGNVVRLYDESGEFIGKGVIESKRTSIEKGRFFHNGSYYKERYKSDGKLQIQSNDNKIFLNMMFFDYKSFIQKR